MALCKEGSKYYIVAVKLKPEIWQADKMNRMLEAGRCVYNALLGKVLSRYNEMIKTKAYRDLYASLVHDDEKDADTWEKIDALCKKYRLTQFDVINDVKPMQHHFKKLLHSQVCQKIASQVWSAIKSVMHKSSRKVHFKKYGTFNSLSGAESTKGIIFANDSVSFGRTLKMVIPVEYNRYNIKNVYYENCLFSNLDKIKYCQIVRKEIRGKYQYYIHIIISGSKVSSRYKLGEGRVGIDIGTSTVAVSSDSDVFIKELAEKAQIYEKEKREIQRKMDRSQRATNTKKYNEDGTFNKKNKDKWVRSNRYLKLRQKLRECYRKQRIYRELSHNALTNHMLTLGDEFYVEKMNFASLARRSKKKTKKCKNGKCAKKKRFGKSICNRAPSKFLSILERKLMYFDKELHKINTSTCKASQFNHVTKEYEKKPLRQRWNNIAGNLVQRDIYSAFLISNVYKNMRSINAKLCREKFDNFMRLHDDEINQLKQEKLETGRKFLTSIGI